MILKKALINEKSVNLIFWLNCQMVIFC